MDDAHPTCKFLVPYDEFISGPGAEWLIEGFLPARGLAMLYAQSGAFKTFVALHMGRAVITGEPFCGFEVSKDPEAPSGQKPSVIYIALEGVGGARKRVQGAFEGVDQSDLKRFRSVEHPFRMPTASAREWRDLLSELEAFAKVAGPIKLIIIDTFAQFSEADENNSTAVSGVVRMLQQLISKTGATVCLIHHTGKPAKKGGKTNGMRGSSALNAAADSVFFLERLNETSLITRIKCEKQKDFEEFKEFSIEMEEIALGVKKTLRVRGLADPKTAALHKKAGDTAKQTSPARDTAKAAILDALSGAVGGKQHKELKAALVPKIVSDGTFSAAMRELEEEGLISKAEDGCWVKVSD